MTAPAISRSIDPVTSAGRNTALDALRGAALLGVLMINLLAGFRASLFEHILTIHTHAGVANRVVDIVTSWLFEFKAFTLFSFLFGVGMGIQAQRTASRQTNTSRFLARRFAALLAIGICHMLLIWNGDILTLYAVCGLLLIPFVRMSVRWQASIGIALIAVAPYLPFFGAFFPTAGSMRAHAAVATRVYATGGFAEIMPLRFSEAGHFILPLLIASLPRTAGLMLCGAAAWKSGVLQRPEEHRFLLKSAFAVAGGLGSSATTLQVWARETGHPPPAAFDWLYPYSAVLLGLAYGEGILLWQTSARGRVQSAARLLAAAGQMALSNDLSQSIIFSLVFYGFGLGLFGRVGSAPAVILGLAVYGMQLILSKLWLQYFCFGPAEWLWRSMTYGRWQPFRRI